MPYTPPANNAIDFNFTASGYTAPAAGSLAYNFEGDGVARILTTTLAATPTIRRLLSRVRALTQATTPVMERLRGYIQAMTAPAPGTASMTRSKGFPRALSVTKSLVSSLSKLSSRIRSMTSAASTVATRSRILYRSVTAVSALQVTRQRAAAFVRTLGLTLQPSRVRALLRSYAVSSGLSAAVSAPARRLQVLTLSVTSATVLTRTKVLFKHLTAGPGVSAVMDRIRALRYTLSVVEVLSISGLPQAALSRVLSVTTGLSASSRKRVARVVAVAQALMSTRQRVVGRARTASSATAASFFRTYQRVMRMNTTPFPLRTRVVSKQRNSTLQVSAVQNKRVALVALVAAIATTASRAQSTFAAGFQKAQDVLRSTLKRWW